MTSESPGRELGPGHWDGEERDCGAAGGEGFGEDQEGRKKVTEPVDMD